VGQAFGGIGAPKAPREPQKWLEKAQRYRKIMQNETKNTEVRNIALALLCTVTYSALP
jgi:hypothetical protein